MDQNPPTWYINDAQLQVAGQRYVIYVPVLLTLTIVSFGDVNLKQKNVKAMCELRVILNLKNFDVLSEDKQMKLKIIERLETDKPLNRIKFMKNKHELFQSNRHASGSSSVEGVNDQHFTYKFKKQIDFQIRICQQHQNFFFPTTILQIHTYVTIDSIFKDYQRNQRMYLIKKNEEIDGIKEVHYKFNFMNSSNPSNIIRFNSSLKQFQDYTLANNLIQVQVQNKERCGSELKQSIISNDEQFMFNSGEEKKILENIQVQYDISEEYFRQFNFIHFRIPFYKDPSTQILSIFLPLGIVAIIICSAFMIAPQLHTRLGTFTNTILFSAALIPISRASKPPLSSWNIMDVLLILSLVPPILLIIQSYEIRHLSTYDFTPFSDNNQIATAYFYISFAIYLFIFGFIAFIWVGFSYNWWGKQRTKEYQVSNKIHPIKLNQWISNKYKAFFIKYMESKRQSFFTSAQQLAKDKQDPILKNVKDYCKQWKKRKDQQQKRKSMEQERKKQEQDQKREEQERKKENHRKPKPKEQLPPINLSEMNLKEKLV